MLSPHLFDWENRCRSASGIDLKHSQMLVARKPPSQDGLWFLESLYHMGVPAALPDGVSSNFVIKPVRSSVNFTIPDGDGYVGDATLVMYLANPLGRIAELWFYNEDSDSEYDAAILFNMAQPLPKDFDYARFVKGIMSIVSSTIPAGAFQINGRAVCVRFPYPASEKPSVDETNSAKSKYGYQGLVGVQSDPCNIVSGVPMLTPVIVTEFGHFGEKPLRLSDSVVTSNSNTTVVANDARQSLNYVVDAKLAVNESRTFTDVPTYFRTGQILVTAVAGISAEVQFSGSMVPDIPGPSAFQVVYYLETYDLMGRVIDTIARPITIRWDGLVDDKVDFLRSFKFVAPEVGQILNKPTIHRIEIGASVACLTDDITVTPFNLRVDAEIHVVAGDALGVGRPSVIWACSGAKGLQFNLEVGQWFEAIPNSRVLQTTTTIPVPHGSLANIEDFYRGIEYLLERDEWRYVWTGPDWMAATREFNHAKMLTWKTSLPEIIEQINEEGAECASAKTLFKKLGHELAKDGKKFAKVLGKQGLKLARQVAPEVLDMAAKRIGSEFGLTDKQIAAAEHLLHRTLGGKTAGGSLAGGSLASSHVSQTRKYAQYAASRGYCATEGEIPDIEECEKILGVQSKSQIIVQSDGSFDREQLERIVKDIASKRKVKREAIIYDSPSSEPGSYDIEANITYPCTSTPIDMVRKWCGGICATKNKSVPKPSTIEAKSYTVSWKETRGCFVPALFFLTANDHVVTASGLYYLWSDKKVYDEHKKPAPGTSPQGEWTKDAKGNRLVGHVDQEFEAIIPPYACLMAVNKVEEGPDYDLRIIGDFTRPATGRSVEAGVTALRLWESHGNRFKLVVAITGDLIKPSDGHGWRFAEMPASFGYYKKQAVKNLLPYRIPVIGNWAGADIVVHNFSDLRKALDIVVRRGGMCATSNCHTDSVPHCYKHPIEMWKNGLNPNFNLMAWLHEYANSYAIQGSIVRDSDGFGLWLPTEKAEELSEQPADISYGVCAPSKRPKDTEDPGKILSALRKDLESTKRDLVNLAKMSQTHHNMLKQVAVSLDKMHKKESSGPKNKDGVKKQDARPKREPGNQRTKATLDEVKKKLIDTYTPTWEKMTDDKKQFENNEVGVVEFMTNLINSFDKIPPRSKDPEIAAAKAFFDL